MEKGERYNNVLSSRRTWHLRCIVRDSIQLDSALYGTEFSLDQRCTGQHSEWLSVVRDRIQLGSALSGTSVWFSSAMSETALNCTFNTFKNTKHEQYVCTKCIAWHILKSKGPVRGSSEIKCRIKRMSKDETKKLEILPAPGKKII